MSALVKHIVCPFCKEALTIATGLYRCATCRTFAHQACWESNNGCAVFGCGGKHALSYRGRLGKYGQWPLNGLICLISGLSVLLVIGVLGYEQLGKIIFSSGLLLCGCLFITAYRDPERNHLSRWMWDSCEKSSIYGARYLVLVGILFLCLGTASMVSAIIQ